MKINATTENTADTVNSAIEETTLNYVNGKFILENVSNPKLRLKLFQNPCWTNLGNDAYETGNLGAAVAFRRYGVDNVEKLFKQTFQTHYALPNLPPLPDLDPHQIEGLKWILSRKRSYLAHAPGAGKTAQAIIASCLSESTGQTVLIVPPSLTLNWEREIYRFSPWVGNYSRVAIVPTSDKKDRMDWSAGFIICPDSMLSKPWVYDRLHRMEKKFIAVDEASRLKDSLSERSLAFYGGTSKGTRYPGLFRKARHVVFLDGSPMPNRPIELWAPTFALHPEAIDCRDIDDFGYRYCGAKPNAYGQWEYLFSSNEAELREKLRKDFMHVVTESELSHPERQRSMVMMNVDVRSAEHKTWERSHLGQIPSTGLSEDLSQGDMARFRRELGVRKVPWVAKYVAERLREKNESILVFAWHREVCLSLGEALGKWNPGVIMGGTPSAEREKYFAEFQSGARKILILNIAAGGRGHNLQRADRVIFAEWSWTDELNKQCEKRASRRGNDREYVRCEYLVNPGSMDEPVLSSVFTKQRRVERIIG